METELPLNPTDVDYPQKRHFSVRTTQDGGTIIQRPLRDGRLRKWIWRNYGPAMPEFPAQWAMLEGLEYRTRLEAGLPTKVGIWEDVSGVGGFDRMAGNNRLYTTVKVVQTDRVPRKGGGPLIYDSIVEFHIDDPSYTSF